MKMRQSNEEKRTRWASVIAEREASGESVAAYCRQRDIPTWKYHYWSRRLKGEGVERREGDFVEMRFDGGGGSGVWFDLGAGVRLVVERGFDAEELRRVLRALGAGTAAC